jgi:DNA-binding FadR family transcriptional regulator
MTDADLAALLGPVRAGNAFEETVERLLTVIKLGLVARGDRFPPERELSALLGVSRLTLREAIRALQQAGYVESRRGRFGGTFVTYTRPAPDPKEVRRIALEDSDRLTDALTFRLVVETGAAEVLAAQVMAQPSGDYGRDILLARLEDLNNATPGDYRRLDTLFHLCIAELTGSSLLAAACTDARMRLNDLLNAIPVLQHNIDHTAEQHTAIAEAILAGDAERARWAVAEHLDGTAALLRGFLATPARPTPRVQTAAVQPVPSAPPVPSASLVSPAARPEPAARAGSAARADAAARAGPAPPADLGTHGDSAARAEPSASAEPIVRAEPATRIGRIRRVGGSRRAGRG